MTKATWCAAHEPNHTKCDEEWKEICNRDGKVYPACHRMLFGYDYTVDVKNITEYTVTGLEEGKTYFFAATAYDEDGNESAFSIELTHTFTAPEPIAAPRAPAAFAPIDIK